MTRAPEDLTRLLHDVVDGNMPADELLPVVYEELRSLARARMAGERPGQTLQATALVHEAYLRVIGKEDPKWNGRGHFFGAWKQKIRAKPESSTRATSPASRQRKPPTP